MNFTKTFLLACLFVFGYHFSSAQSDTIYIDSLLMYNMEEDKNILPKGDEILLIAGIYDFEADSILHLSNSGILLFNDSVSTHTNFAKAPIDSGQTLFIMFIEIDTELSVEEIEKKCLTAFNENNQYPPSLLQSKINSALKDDDLLHFYYYELENLIDISSIPLKGMHMFNRYSYKLFLELR